MQVLNANLKYRRALTPLNIDKVCFIVVHHIDAKTATPETIHKWHLERDNGTWLGGGYNEYIRKDGTVYIMRGDNVGSHCKGYNEQSYGIALEGDFQVEPIGEVQFNVLIERLKYHKARFKSLKSIVGHRDLSSTSCPGRNIDMGTINNAVYNDETNTKRDEPEHWVLKHWQSLKDKGMVIHEQRFEEGVKRGELFSLLDQIVK